MSLFYRGPCSQTPDQYASTGWCDECGEPLRGATVVVAHPWGGSRITNRDNVGIMCMGVRHEHCWQTFCERNRIELIEDLFHREVESTWRGLWGVLPVGFGGSKPAQCSHYGCQERFHSGSRVIATKYTIYHTDCAAGILPSPARDLNLIIGPEGDTSMETFRITRAVETKNDDGEVIDRHLDDPVIVHAKNRRAALLKFVQNNEVDVDTDVVNVEVVNFYPIAELG